MEEKRKEDRRKQDRRKDRREELIHMVFKAVRDRCMTCTVLRPVKVNPDVVIAAHTFKT